MEKEFYCISRRTGDSIFDAELCGVYSSYEKALLALPPRQEEYEILRYNVDHYIYKREEGLKPYTVILFPKKLPEVSITPPEQWIDKYTICSEENVIAYVWADSKKTAIKKAVEHYLEFNNKPEWMPKL